MAKQTRNYLVSGVTSGIGKAFCNLVLEMGGSVIPIVRDKSKLDRTKFDQMIELDFEDTEAIEEVFRNFSLEIYSFVNFAGILPGNSFKEYEPKLLEKLFKINVLAPMLIIKTIEKNFSKGGSIVLLGSVSAQKGSYDDGYAASKGAIHSLVKSLSLKFAPNVRVIGIAPSMTNNTRMTDELIEGRYEYNLKTIPLQKAGEPEDISRLIYVISGESGAYMTGNMIDINGGQYLR